MASKVFVKGLSELQVFLNQLAPKIQMNIARGALRAGAKVIAEEAKAICPIGPPSTEGSKLYGGREGALRDSIRIGSRMENGKAIGYVKAGSIKGKIKGANVFYAHMVEFGAVAHGMGKKNAGLRVLKFNDAFRNSVWHPGMAAKPFMRPALDAKAQDAVLAVGEYIKKRLDAGGLDVADIVIEEDE